MGHLKIIYDCDSFDTFKVTKDKFKGEMFVTITVIKFNVGIMPRNKFDKYSLTGTKVIDGTSFAYGSTIQADSIIALHSVQ